VGSLAGRGDMEVEVQELLEGGMEEREAWTRGFECMGGGRLRVKVVFAIP